MDRIIENLTNLIRKHCNDNNDSIASIRQRVRESVIAGTYRVMYDSKENIVGYIDYGISSDGIVHIIKLIALKPGIITKLVWNLRKELPWRRVFWFSAKKDKWIHRRRVNNALV